MELKTYFPRVGYKYRLSADIGSIPAGTILEVLRVEVRAFAHEGTEMLVIECTDRDIILNPVRDASIIADLEGYMIELGTFERDGKLKEKVSLAARAHEKAIEETRIMNELLREELMQLLPTERLKWPGMSDDEIMRRLLKARRKID